jgi:hypothetical protein
MTVELVDRMAILVAIRRFPCMRGAADSRPLRYNTFVNMQYFVCRSTSLPFRRCLGDVRREFMQRLHDALHGTLDSYFHDTLQEGDADAVARLSVPRPVGFPPPFSRLIDGFHSFFM